MTILSVVGGKGPGPMEGEEPERPSRPLLVSLQSNEQTVLTAEELIFFDKVKEFLGSSVNERMLVQAIKSHGSQTQPHLSGSHVLNDVISLYFDRMESEIDKPNKQVRFDQHLETPSPAPPISRPYSFNTRGTTMDGPKEVIDLALDEDKNVQKWGSVPRSMLGNREEQDVIKAIEESLKDNQNIPGFSPFAQKDPENPHERQRCGLTPVGLKNIGNSCWFNVIMQTLYHIPRFRQMLFDANIKNMTTVVLNKQNAWRTESGSHNEMNTGAVTVSLLLALRRLAACLKASSRAYVDPTDLLKIISELNTNLNKAVPCIGIQQDATEMLLRLIEWLEQAFKERPVSEVGFSGPSASHTSNEELMETNDENMVPSGSSSEQTLTPGGETSADDSAIDDLNSNPVLEHPFNALFHGSHVEIRPNADGMSSPLKLANSLQMINLDVTFDNLYDSLEAYHFSDSPAKEMWFESLPPVIIFSLVRFSYKNGQTEKVHSKFQFPRDMYMDRYLYRNRTFVSEKRIERNSMKRRLSHVKCQLEGWEKFPAGEMNLPLPSLIDAVVKYTSSASVGNAATKCNAYNQQPMEICGETLSLSEGTALSDLSSFHTGLNELGGKNADSSCPSLDKTIIPGDIDVDAVTRFLQALSADARKTIDELQKEANTLQENIDSIFDVDGMREEQYRLHSVIVHEGEANVGHYWAYISSSSLSSEQNKEVSWRKFNDKSVEPATWQQIEEDSFGSRRACSAYCLVYTRMKCEAVLYGEDKEQPAKSIRELVDSLPSDLKQEIVADNALFDAEMIKWNSENPPVEFGPENKTHVDPCENSQWTVMREMLDIISYKGPVDFDSLSKRHYKHAERFFGTLMVKNALNRLNGSNHEMFLEREDNILSLIQELLTNWKEHYTKAQRLTSDLHADRLMFMIDWAQMFGVLLDQSAQSIFLLRMLMQMDTLQQTKLASSCEGLIEKCVAENPSAGQNLNDVHILYEVFCQMIAVMNEIVQKVSIQKSSSSPCSQKLSMDIQQSKLLCAAIRMMDKIEMYADSRYSEEGEIMFCYLVQNALLIVYVIRISEDLIDCIREHKGDTILVENENFLNKEYRAMIIRLHGRCHNSASERTLQYVVSKWNQLLSDLNGMQRVPKFFQKIVDAAEKTRSPMPTIKLNVKAVNSGHDLFLLRKGMHNLGLRNVDDLNVLVHKVVQERGDRKITADKG